LILVGKDGTGKDGIVLRYNTNGALDNTFGQNGVVVTNLGSLTDEYTDVAVQTDGRLIVSASTEVASKKVFAAVRYNTDGTLDNSFGQNGVVTTDLSGAFDRADTIELQSDGRILLGGNTTRTNPNNSSDTAAAMVRYNSNGSLDQTFGVGGIAEADFFDGPDLILDLVVQADGRIVAAGTSRVSNSSLSEDFLVARFNANGTPDATFGTQGRVATDFGNGLDFGRSVILQAGDNILLTGDALLFDAAGIISSREFALARYLSSGCPASDVSVTLSATATAFIGQNLIYQVEITNQGTTAQDLRLVMDTPANTTFVSFQSPNGTVNLFTPGAGSTGTVLCDVADLPAQTTVTAQLTVNIRNQTPNQTNILGRVDILPKGPDPVAANNFATVLTLAQAFDICIADSTINLLIRFNSVTGDYQFFDCRKDGVLTGKGTLMVNGCKIELRDSGPNTKKPDRNVFAAANPCTKQGNATIQIFAEAKIHNFSDTDITNNTCACQ
jgi:uncharacterized delta-60 repeat protein/uncharacterized repeat protein (TIGR01451 family)